MNTSLLPELVHDYADAVLTGPTPRTGKVRLEQVGEMVLKPGGRAQRFEAIETLAIECVGFAWRARFPVIGPLALRVTDSYQRPEGRLEVRALGIPVQRSSGPELARGQALRYLAEIAWVPQAIVANRELEWRALDERTAEVSTDVAGERIAVRLVFDGEEIVRTVAYRPRLEAGGAVTQWIGEYSDYTSFGDSRVPSRGEVHWELPEGPFTYWRGSITATELCD